MVSGNLPKDWLEVITRTVRQEIEKEEYKKQKEKRDYRFRNTELLCKNYRKISAHCENLPEQIQQLHQEFDLGMFDGKIDLRETMKSKQKTKMMMDYVDAMLEAYKHLSLQGGEVAARRYKILFDMYICHQVLSPGDLYDKYGVERSTFYRDLKKSIEEFSIVLFGIDAFDFVENGKKRDKSATNK